MHITQKCINEIRAITAQTISNANSGHTGSSVGATAILYSLFKDHYFYNNNDANFIARDRLVLSAGHISPLYYVLLNAFNMGIGDEDLKKLRKLNSITPGHPEYGKTKGVEVSTGALGQGVANAVGMAIGQSMLASRFNAQKANIIDNYTYCFCGDGCLQEGVTMEACSLAGTLKLNKLILLYDCNYTTIDGNLTISNTENVARKFKSMNWNVIKVNNGNSYYWCTRAIARAKKSNKPSIIIFKTEIGFGTSYAGSNKAHAIKLNEKELIEFKKDLEVDNISTFSKETKIYCERTIRKNKINLERWNRMFVLYEQTHPDLCKQFKQFISDKNVDVLKINKEFLKETNKGIDINSKILTEIAQKLPRFVGGTADVSASTRSIINQGGDYSSKNRKGKNIHFGVREHAMGAICNGLCLYLNSPVFCSTFLAFSNHMIPAIRMSAMMNLPVLYLFTHDSYKMGEDGPSHQPVEQLGQLRLIPNLNVFRPADANEMVYCYKMALTLKNPSVLAIAKQELEPITNGNKNISRGGYVLSGEKGKIRIFASGAEVKLALEVKELLEKENIKAVVCSFPSLSAFEEQTTQYKNSVLGTNELKVVIEPSNDNAWYKYIASKDLFINLTKFGQSASAEELDKYLGYIPKSIVARIKSKLGK